MSESMESGANSAETETTEDTTMSTKGDTTATDAPSTDGDIIASGVVKKAHLQQFLDTLEAFAGESRIHWNEEGLSASLVDPANVVMACPATLHADGFESYSSPGSATIGVDLERLGDYISNAASGDMVSLSVDMETRKLEIEYGVVQHEMALIDPDTIRQEPEKAELDLPNSVTLTGADMKLVAEETERTSDHVTVIGDPDAEEVRFVAEGDTDDTTLTFGDEEVVGARVTERTEAMFSLEYLGDLAKPMPKEAEVNLRFGDSFPLELDWMACEGTQATSAMLAPRVDTS